MQITIKTPIQFENNKDCMKVFNILTKISDQLLCIELLNGKPAIYTFYEVKERERLQSLAWEQEHEMKIKKSNRNEKGFTSNSF